MNSYPIFLRFIIWTLLRLIPDNSRFEDYRITLRFLLDHPVGSRLARDYN